MTCRRCHEGETARLAAGFGTNRFVSTDGNGISHRLDQVQNEQGEPVVTFGPRLDVRAAPLPLDVVDRLINSPIDFPACDVDASTGLPFSLLRDRWLRPQCERCHDGSQLPQMDHAAIVSQTQGASLVQSSLWRLLSQGHQQAQFELCDQNALRGWYEGGRRDD